MPIKIHELIVRVNVTNEKSYKTNKKELNGLNHQTMNLFLTHYRRTIENSITSKYDDKNER